ncbi:hypothetical protein BOX15_Mlig006511g2, partial [Macrostomum lignano]
ARCPLVHPAAPMQPSQSSAAFDVAVMGSVVYDLIAYVDTAVRPGETRIGSSFGMGAGGKGANQCTMASFLGSRAAMVGKIGDDLFGREYMKYFSKHGIHTEHLLMEAGASTGVASITVTGGGENTIVVVPGANFRLTPADIDRAAGVLAAAKVVVCQLEVPIDVTTRALKIAREAGAMTILNPAPAPVTPTPPELLALADVVCPNQQEATAITGLPCTTDQDVDAVLRRLRELGCRLPMVTLGASGVAFLDGDQVLRVPAPAVEAIDTTGAGDAFMGSLAHFCACRPDLPMAARVSRAVRIAAISVTRPGTQTSFPHREELPADLRD